VLNVEIRGCLHGENKSIISKILIFVGAFAPTIYNVASPLAQYAGSFSDYEWSKWWRAKAEHKCLFFCWLILQNKVWTADRIVKHGGSSNPICKLCYSHPQRALHMLVQCPYSNSIWMSLSPRIGTPIQQPPTSVYHRLRVWWRHVSQAGVQGMTQRQERV
jgi:hypothetical protein